MSNSNVKASNIEVFARAKNTHYAVSTFAAVVYALVWFLSNGAHAETTAATTAHAVLAPIVVTEYRTMLPEVVVVGERSAAERVAVLDAIVVTGKQTDVGPRVAATVAHQSYASKVRNWFRSTLAKVSG